MNKIQMNKMNDFNCIAGYKKVKEELIGLRNMLLNIEKFKEFGIRIPRGVLLYGPPGVGKTIMARAIAGNDIPLIELRAADCTGEDPEDRVIEIFEEARKNTPCILLIDELDKVAAEKELYYMENNDRIMKILLQELDGQKDNSGILVVGTCNNCHNINEALRRPGRFDRVIEIEVPSLADRIEIINYYLSDIKLDIKFDIESLAKIMAGYSCASIECIINEAGAMSMQKGLDYIDIATIQIAVNRILFNALEGELTNENEKWKVAVHEAGHAVALLTLSPQSLSTVSIIPQGNTYGHVELIYEEDVCQSIEMTENNIIASLSGCAAEEIILHERYISSAQDFKNARKNLNFLVWGIGAYGIEFAGLFEKTAAKYGISQKLLGQGDDICCEKFKEFYSRSLQIIKENKHLVELIAHALIDKSTMSRDEIVSLYGIASKIKAA